MFPNNFISATKEYCTFEKHVNAPYIRKHVDLKNDSKAEIVITGLGFYRLFVNGKEITKGILAPYISAPDDVVCYDKYEVTLEKGENIIGVILGNGMQNAFGGAVWDFDKAAWRGAPKTAFSIKTDEGIFESDLDCKCHPSPITYDDLRGGEHYDARLEIENWSEPSLDDSDWKNVIEADEPKGEKRFVVADPIVVTQRLAPVSVTKVNDGYVYDFGVNAAGNVLLKMKGEKGQKVTIRHGELLNEDGSLDQKNLYCDSRQITTQTCEYTFKGEGVEEYTPYFTYNGFRYVQLEGVEDCKPENLTYLVQNSDLKSRGSLECSSETVNKLMEATNRSTLANFFYFPTDCPHREKNGWMGDAAVSAEQTLLNHEPERSYEEWLCHIRNVQRSDGALPGIVPTGGWGFAWGNGPAWDCAFIVIPYFTYLYRNDKKILEDNADHIYKYLQYMKSKRDEKGLTHYGLGDWCSPQHHTVGKPKSPQVVTDTLTCIDMLQKSAYIFNVLGMNDREEDCKKTRLEMISSFRDHLVDFDTMVVEGNCQTSQAMALYYGVFEGEEFKKAYSVLLKMISDNDGMHDCGILGCRVIFDLLADNGDVDLALDMIISEKYPAFGNWIKRGATSLWEHFPRETDPFFSINHHFFGMITAFFYRQLAGIRIDESGVKIEPKYPKALDWVKATHKTNDETIVVEWKRVNGKIELDVKHL